MLLDDTERVPCNDRESDRDADRDDDRVGDGEGVCTGESDADNVVVTDGA